MDAIMNGFETVATAASIANTVVTESWILTGKISSSSNEGVENDNAPGQVRTRVRRL